MVTSLMCLQLMNNPHCWEMSGRKLNRGKGKSFFFFNKCCLCFVIPESVNKWFLVGIQRSSPSLDLQSHDEDEDFFFQIR